MAETHHTGIPRLQWAGAYPPCTPSVVITADLNPFCAGDSVTFTPSFTCITGVTISAYAWVINGAIVNTSVEPYVTITLADNDRVGFLFVTSNGNTYFSNVVTMVEKTVGCVELGLELTFDDIANVPVTNASSVSDWNTFFDLPTNGTPFTSVDVVGNVVTLFGGENVHLKDYLFYFGVSGDSDHLLKMIDFNGIVISAGIGSLEWNGYLNELSLPNIISMGDSCCHGCYASNILFSLPLLVSAGISCFSECNNTEVINLPSLITAGDRCFQYVGAGLFGGGLGATFTLPLLQALGGLCFSDCVNPIISIPSCTDLGGSVLDNFVFFYEMYITTAVTLTIPVSLMTCNAGNPDGDIQWIQDPVNSVTAIIITV